MTSPSPSPSVLRRLFTPMSLRSAATWALVLTGLAMLVIWDDSALGRSLLLCSTALLAGAVHRSRPQEQSARR